jgi:hypothetical protein
MASKAQLWRIQRQEFPNSVRIDALEALMWCKKAESGNQEFIRYREIANALLYPNVVFYYIAGTMWRGYRFGTKPSDYVSLALI